jgi:Domain of unknown function (DUF4279)
MGKLALSLRLRHPSMDVGQLSRQLGFEPNRAWRAGEPNISPIGRALEGSSTSSYSTASIDLDSASDLADALSGCVTRLEAHKSTLSDFVRTGGSTAFFIGWFLDRNEGEILGSTLLGRLSQLEISLEFDVYPPDLPRSG